MRFQQGQTEKKFRKLLDLHFDKEIRFCAGCNSMYLSFQSAIQLPESFLLRHTHLPANASKVVSYLPFILWIHLDSKNHEVIYKTNLTSYKHTQTLL